MVLDRVRVVSLIIGSLFLMLMKANAQFEFQNTDQVSKIRGTTTYIAMHDTGTATAQRYKAIFLKYWTISKVQFITYSEISKYLAPGTSFLTIDLATDVVSGNTGWVWNQAACPGEKYDGMRDLNICISLWMPKDKFFSKKNAKFDPNYKVQILRIDLFADYETVHNRDSLLLYDYDMAGHIRDWGPGFLKNYIQIMMNLLNTGKKRELYEDLDGTSELKNLQTETLYVPQYILLKYNQKKDKEQKLLDEKDMMEDYKYSYKMVSTDELNNMITEDGKGIYYLVYVKSGTMKYVSVFDSKTGEILYSKFHELSWNMESKDIKELYKAISK